MTYRQVMVDGSPVGVQGLDAVFAALHEAGWEAGDEGLGAEIVRRVEGDTYVPYGARTVYAAAFAREYAAYLARMEGDTPQRARGYGNWRGYPREQVPWFPTVNADLCDGCGVCLRLCSTHALAPTEEGAVWVADPFACVVGCSSCAHVCRPGAITFPPRAMLEAYRRR